MDNVVIEGEVNLLNEMDGETNLQTPLDGEMNQVIFIDTGGTTDYEELENLPTIGGVTVMGDKTLEDYGLPTIPTVPTDVSTFNNDAGYVNATQAANAAPVQSVNGSTGAVTVSVPTAVSQLSNDSGFVNSAGAASAAPVQSVNGQTGAVSLTIPTVPSDISAFNNDSGYVDAAGAAAAAPVQSVNGATGDVSLSIPTTAADIGAAAASHTHGFLKNDGTFASQAVVASGDYLVITDKGDGYKMRHCTIQFGSSTTQYLANNGTWQNVPTAVSDLTNDSGFLTLADLPIYNGGVL